jgi:hypothetical protein
VSTARYFGLGESLREWLTPEFYYVRAANTSRLPIECVQEGKVKRFDTARSPNTGDIGCSRLVHHIHTHRAARNPLYMCCDVKGSLQHFGEFL